MPSVPIEIPSEIVMLLNITGLTLCLERDLLTLSASLSICMLQGVT